MSQHKLKAIKVSPFTESSTLILASDSEGKIGLYLLEGQKVKPFT